jgi:hypothetical protein
MQRFVAEDLRDINFISDSSLAQINYGAWGSVVVKALPY